MANALAALPIAPAESARVAGLRHVDPEALPGLRRLRRGRGFVYVEASGRPVRDDATLERIRRLAIPPAWQEVWICPVPDGHIQAVGRDARGRKQYRYHARWREVRDATKFDKMLAFSRALPRIRAACRRDLGRAGLPRAKVLATVVRLLDLTHARVGNEEYTRENGSYGLTTLRDWHVRVAGPNVRFRFRGKAGKTREVGVRDRRLARVVAMCSELPGHELFRYADATGALRSITSGDVNEYIRAVAGQEFTAKDFRTWAGTVLAAKALRDRTAGPPAAPGRSSPGAPRRPQRPQGPRGQRGAAKKAVVECIQAVAAHLGNTPAVCRRCYVHPAVIDGYLDGSLQRIGRCEDETLVRTLLVRVVSAGEGERLRGALRASLRAVKAGRGR